MSTSNDSDRREKPVINYVVKQLNDYGEPIMILKGKAAEDFVNNMEQPLSSLPSFDTEEEAIAHHVKFMAGARSQDTTEKQPAGTRKQNTTKKPPCKKGTGHAKNSTVIAPLKPLLNRRKHAVLKHVVLGDMKKYNVIKSRSKPIAPYD